MTSEILRPPERSSVLNAEASLDKMMGRLEAIVAEPTLTSQTLVEVTAIYNNVSYLFLYLEANDDHVNFTRLLPKRDLFYNNPSLDRRILAMLLACAFDDPKLEKSRTAYVRQLTEKLTANGSATMEINRLKAHAQTLEEAVTADQLDRIEKLGLSVKGERPSTIFYRVIGQTTRPQTREKLARVWTLAGEDHRIEMASVIDQMISIRRRGASAPDGRGSPLAETLRKCCVDESTVAPFLERYIELALLEQRRLEDEIASALNVSSDPIAHFSYYLRFKFGPHGAPLFNLNACLSYIFSVAKAVFGLDFAVNQNDSSPVILAMVTRNGMPVGKINFDLWSNHGKDLGANHTIGLRNRAEWGDIVQRPEAWVSCRFENRRSDERLITFQNVHSLFHEFGHAINHLLVREDIPNRSGLEYLPLERLEYLSMWFEKWVYHRAFGEHLDLSENELEGLRFCQAAKKIEYRRTYVERAVASFLDFECHRRSDVTLRGCFDELDAKCGIGSFVNFADFPPYFTWPMFIANPGANFAYLWGAAWSCTHFCRLEDRSLSNIALYPGLSGWFEPCFNFEIQSMAPDPQSIFSFYCTSDEPAGDVDEAALLRCR